MADSLRTFLGIPVTPTPELLIALEEIRELGSAFRVVVPENLHITVKFLGKTNPDLIPDLMAGLAELVSEFNPFELEISGLGVFPHLRRPSVLWAGVADSQSLTALAAATDSLCEEFGFDRETRTYHPHVTLARISRKPPPEFEYYLASNNESCYALEEAREVCLFESRQTDAGVRYPVQERVAFGE